MSYPLWIGNMDTLDGASPDLVKDSNGTQTRVDEKSAEHVEPMVAPSNLFDYVPLESENPKEDIIPSLVNEDGPIVEGDIDDIPSQVLSGGEEAATKSAGEEEKGEHTDIYSSEDESDDDDSWMEYLPPGVGARGRPSRPAVGGLVKEQVTKPNPKPN
ncbi:hypothetical protein BDQ17DRAFT_1434813 [Cyathus striatus]|nr:hypothetical protein BDQ17DRAFT_1434813 [Cyathus striatus]